MKRWPCLRWPKKTVHPSVSLRHTGTGSLIVGWIEAALTAGTPSNQSTDFLGGNISEGRKAMSGWVTDNRELWTSSWVSDVLHFIMEELSELIRTECRLNVRRDGSNRQFSKFQILRGCDAASAMHLLRQFFSFERTKLRRTPVFHPDLLPLDSWCNKETSSALSCFESIN